MLKFFMFLMFCCLVAPKPAFAYLDPGSGSFLLQILIIALAGVMFRIRWIIEKIKKLLNKKSD